MPVHPPKLIVIVPCYNEAAVLPVSSVQFLDELKSLVGSNKVSPESCILFVDDGSSDATWQVILTLAKSDNHFIGIRQSCNRGHQFALLAGLMEARTLGCEVTVTIDCDGQDDIHAISAMLDEYAKGADVVYGVRNDRSSDTFFKRFTAECFYRFQAVMGVKTVFNHADYRLLSARVIDALSNYHEVNLYLRGLIPLVGFKNACVTYKREKRLAGESHYGLFKMLAFAGDGITSLSIRPIRLVQTGGLVLSLLGMLLVILLLLLWLFRLIPFGTLFVLAFMVFSSGLQLFCIGIIGEYVGKAYLESKARPRFLISDRTWRPPTPPLESSPDNGLAPKAQDNH